MQRAVVPAGIFVLARPARYLRRVTGDGNGSRSSGPWYASDPPTAPFQAVGSERPPGFEGLSGFGGPSPSRRGHRAKPGGSRKRLIAIIAGITAVVAGIAAAVVFVF